jgi:uncharacterized protein with GYD domain
MATYIMLFGFTQQGIEKIKESPARVEAAKQSFQGVGAKVKEFYLVMGMGQYDTLFILDAPDDETVAKAALTIGSLGSVRTETHRAFTQAEFKKIIAGLR